MQLAGGVHRVDGRTARRKRRRDGNGVDVDDSNDVHVCGLDGVDG
jgi:hypothetical protein